MLSVVLGTYNRIDQLKSCIQSVVNQTESSFKLYVTDAGSTDGTIEYLKSIASDSIIPIFVGERIGQAKAYNDVFAIVDTPYVCWLSDDNVVVNNGLDVALNILKADSSIGMVALKTKDMQGPFANAPYIGGISEAGILNVNQGMLPTHVLKQVGGFSEEFRDYGIDPALTAEVLFAGYKIVYTKIIALHHYRNWSEDPTSENYKWLQERHQLAKELYASKYSNSAHNATSTNKYKRYAIHKLGKILSKAFKAGDIRASVFFRDLFNALSGAYISNFDAIKHKNKEYHLVQRRTHATL